jgi:toxin ParE1/3/4
VTHRVVFARSAENDLDSIDDYIARDNPEAAAAFVYRIRDTCLQLSEFPHRGTRRDDLKPGLRTFGFERRVTVVFRIQGANGPHPSSTLWWPGSDVAHASSIGAIPLLDCSTLSAP